jgi:transcriptional regulator GlxA family with amidase domain
MAANATFGLHTELPANRISDKEWRDYECTMCHGTGRLIKTSPRAGFPRYMIQRIEELLEKHLEGKVGVTEISSRLGYSSSHFFRMFRRSFGVTPHNYVMRCRVAVAQQLLTQTDLGLVDIALKAGFCDQSHLSRNFRRFAGMPPRAYRALLQTFPEGDAT